MIMLMFCIVDYCACHEKCFLKQVCPCAGMMCLLPVKASLTIVLLTGCEGDSEPRNELSSTCS